MPDKKAMIGAAGGYLVSNPQEIWRAARNAAALRVGLPLDALRWLAGQAKGKKAPKDVEIAAVPPGVRVAASVDAMGTPLRASAVIYVERVSLNEEELRLELRLDEVSLKLLDESADTPIAALLKSGALDLSKPGNLAAFMPKRPAMLVDAKDDRIVLDLKKHPKLAKNQRAEALLALVTSVVSVKAIETDPDHLDVALKAFPAGMNQALEAVRRVL